MPKKAKYSDKIYGELFQELYELKDIEDELERREEADGVFHNIGRNILYLGDKWQGLKNGFIAKAKARSREGDWSMLQLYADIYGEERVDLNRAISKYPKKTILEWIFKLTDYPDNNQEYMQESLAGGQNDKFYQHVLENLITKRMSHLDEQWLQHREEIHENWKKIDWQGNWETWVYLIAIGGLTVNQYIGDGGWVGGVFLLVAIVLVASSLVFRGHYNNVLQGLRSEGYLIMRTENEVMNHVPKELLNYIYNKRLQEQFNEEYFNEGRDTEQNFEDLQEWANDLGKDMNFANTGLMNYMINSNNWFLPAEKSRWYRWVYEKVQADYDRGKLERRTEPLPPRGFHDYETVKRYDEYLMETRNSIQSNVKGVWLKR